MAGIDKIYGTQKQYNELKKWLKENEIPIKCKVGSVFGVGKSKCIFDIRTPSKSLYPKNGYDKEYRPIANFCTEINMWLKKKCKIQWVVDRINEQYGF